MRKVLVLLICFLFVKFTHAQQTERPLDRVLTDIEKRYEISISYNSKIVEGKRVIIPDLSIGLTELFKLIEEQTQLAFKSVDNESYVLINSTRKEPYKIPKATVLDEVVINNYLTSGYTKRIDGAINATPNKIQALPGLIEPDVLQSLQYISGVQSPDETATGINIRGGTPDHNLILWDGIKMYHYSHFFGMVSAFNPYVIDNVKFYRNAAPSEYGSYTSGVIDITSDEAVEPSFKSGLGFNMIHGDAYIKTPVTEKLGIVVSARRSYTDAFETVTFDKYSELIFQNTKITEGNEVFSDELSRTNNTYYFADFSTKFIYNLNDSHKLLLSGIYSRNDLRFQSQFNEINQRTDDEIDIENKGVSLKWNGDWSSQFKTKLVVSASDYDFRFNGEELLSEFFDFETIKENRITEFNINFSTNYKISDNHEVIAGANYTFSELDFTIGNISDVIFNEDFILRSDNSKTSVGTLFGQYNYKSGPWRLSAGLRANYITSLSKFYAEPIVSVKRYLGEDLILNLSLEKRYQYISQIVEFETQDFGLENLVWTLSDDDIPLLESEQASIGVNAKHKDWYFDAEVYAKRITGITSLTNGFNREFNALSQGKNTIFGMDVTLKKQIGNFSSLASYSLTQNDSRFEDLNNGTSFNSNFDIRHYLSLIQSLKLGGFEASLGYIYKSPRPFTPALGLQGSNADDIMIDYGDINSERLTDYHRFDLSAKYSFKPLNNSVRVTLGASLINIFNRRSILNRTYRIVLNTSDASFQLREINRSSIKRSPNLVFRVEF